MDTHMDTRIQSIIQDISDIVKYDSSLSAPEKNAPFGIGARKSLDFFLSLAASFGFETKDYDGYAGEVAWGTGEEFAILVHMDEVPAGVGWTHDPFGGEKDDAAGRIWGRGTMDDKGPAITVLHAMKALKDEGFVPGRRIKLIAGCNEETGWKCIDYYTTHAHMPDEGFSPDADFPVIYAEKGILQIAAHFAVPSAASFGMPSGTSAGTSSSSSSVPTASVPSASVPTAAPSPVGFSGLSGGTASNMVCAKCEAKAPLDADRLSALHLTYDAASGTVISTGKAAHGSTPEKGVNAIPAMLEYLGLDDICSMLFDTYLGLAGLEDETGPLTFSPNIISQESKASQKNKNSEGSADSSAADRKTDGDVISVVCDIRYPASMTEEQIRGILDRSGVPYDIVHSQAPLYNDKNGWLISTLCSVYNEVTGKNVQPIAIGGGTYARALKCGAGFGPEEEGENCPLHEPDEYITYEKIQKCFDIYKLAISRLCG